MNNKSKKVNIIRAIANENRLRLILCLSNPQSVSELLEKCHLSQSALSQHLKILKDCNVANCKKNGKLQIYDVSDKRILSLAKTILEIK